MEGRRCTLALVHGRGAISATTGTLSGITVDGNDITASISSGGIAATLTVRDETIPAVQAELDALAASLAGTLPLERCALREIRSRRAFASKCRSR